MADSPYPHLYDPIGFLRRSTQLYTQRRQDSELPKNYKFTIEELVAFLQSEFQLVDQSQMYYLHAQTTLATIWNINHNLNRPVQVRCKNEDEENMVGEPYDDDMDNTSIEFTTAVKGFALCT